MSIATSEVAAPYAQALLSIAKSKDSVDDLSHIAADLLNFAQGVRRALKDFLENPLLMQMPRKASSEQVLG